MTALQHTPGPWRYKKCPCGDPVCTRYRISHAGSEGMFDIDDAVLIAAAPDLLDALKELVAYGAGDLTHARAAIKKATEL